MTILRSGIEELRRALPIAQQMLLTDHVLDSVNDALGTYSQVR